MSVLPATDTSSASNATGLYFAYGSNLLSSRLLARTPSARVVAVARLPGYGLRWHKAASDESGKCDIVPVPGEPGSTATVWGVLWRIALVEKPALDAAETLGIGYEQATVQVQDHKSQAWHSAWTYRALKIDPASLPYDWYQALVVHGALEHGLDEAYVQALRAVQCKPDSDAQRAARHFALLP